MTGLTPYKNIPENTDKREAGYSTSAGIFLIGFI
jgi:hypothetical protein